MADGNGVHSLTYAASNPVTEPTHSRTMALSYIFMCLSATKALVNISSVKKALRISSIALSGLLPRNRSECRDGVNIPQHLFPHTRRWDDHREIIGEKKKRVKLEYRA